MGWRLLVLTVSIVIIGACSSDSVPATINNGDMAALLRARQLWNENEPAAYQYVIRNSCLACTPNVPADSALVIIDETGLQRKVTEPGQSRVSLLTIAAAFDVIREMIQQDFYNQKTFEFDDTYGFPASARVQDGYGHGSIMTVTEFQVIGAN